MEFNPEKSCAYRCGPSYYNDYKFILNGRSIPEKKGFIYLGLPIGDLAFCNKYYDEKIRKVEKSLFSLQGLGCKPHHLKNTTKVIIYKTFCQSILRYPLDIVHLPTYKLKEYDSRQSILLKHLLGLGKYCKTSPLLEAIHIESVSRIYFKHKIFMLKQIKQNKLCTDIFEFLKCHYNSFKSPVNSFFNQLAVVSKVIDIQCNFSNLKSSIQLLNVKFSFKIKGLTDSIKSILYKMNNVTFYSSEYFFLLNLLNNFLNYENFT